MLLLLALAAFLVFLSFVAIFLHKYDFWDEFWLYDIGWLNSVPKHC